MNNVCNILIGRPFRFPNELFITSIEERVCYVEKRNNVNEMPSESKHSKRRYFAANFIHIDL